MQYSDRINKVKVFDLGDKFVYLTEKNSLFINRNEFEFSQSSTFYLINNKIYSAKDFFIDEENVLVQPAHLKGKYFQNMYSQFHKKYTDEKYTYIFQDSKEDPVVKIDRNSTNGNIIGITDLYYLLRNEKEMELYSLATSDKMWESSLHSLLSGDTAIYENHITFNDSFTAMYLHHRNWSEYGFYLIDTVSGKLKDNTNLFGPHFKHHNEKIYSVGRNTSKIQVMELTDFSIGTIDLSNELGEYVFETQCEPFFHKNKLYIALKKKGEDIYSYWGQINLDSYKLEFITEMLRDPNKKSTKENKTFVSMIKANDEIVGVKVPGGILHIYKINDHPA